ncbi:MAG: NTP transferase domain-containing protein [Planctomycetota bacterium]
MYSQPYPCDAILLAAGSGRRLGMPKAFLELKGTWMLPRLVEALHQGGCRNIHVVVREQDVVQLKRRNDWKHASFVVNPDPNAGRTGSALCGLAALNHADAVMVHSCDIPLLSADAVAQLLHAWRQCDQPDRALARLTTPGGKGGHPLLLGKNQVQTLRDFELKQSMRDLLRQDPTSVLNVVRRGDPGPFFDVNTREQLELLESLL